MISTTNTSSKTCIGNVAHQQTARYVNVNIWTRSKALGYNPYSQSLWNAKCLGPTTAEPSEEKFFCAKFFGQTMLGSALRASKKQTTRIFANGGIEHGLSLQTWRCMTSWLVNCWTVEPLARALAMLLNYWHEIEVEIRERGICFIFWTCPSIALKIIIGREPELSGRLVGQLIVGRVQAACARIHVHS